MPMPFESEVFYFVVNHPHGVHRPVLLWIPPITEIEQQINDFKKLINIQNSANKLMSSSSILLEAQINNERKRIKQSKCISYV